MPYGICKLYSVTNTKLLGACDLQCTTLLFCNINRLKELLRAQQHHLITDEIRRELFGASARKDKLQQQQQQQQQAAGVHDDDMMEA
jgi:hypothetical protein